ncbi:MAG: HDIG domain-containing protein [Deltaproteobacteria bacterium]|nr:HDIG domain-containing protein [Deltaproteobacteria bacterium]
MSAPVKPNAPSQRGHEHPDIPEGRHALHFSTIYDRFDGSKPTVWALLFLCSLTAGLVAPSQWAITTYEVSTSLLGSPAQGDIKAPRDIAVEDREVTQERRRAAIAAVKRVYDLDTHVTTSVARRLVKALSNARRQLESEPVDEGSDKPLNVESYKKIFDQALGVAVPLEVAEGFLKLKFSMNVQMQLEDVLKAVQERPLVTSRQSLTAQERHGIVIQEIPDTGKGRLPVDDIGSVLEIDEVPGLVRQLLREAESSELEGIGVQWAANLMTLLVRPNLTPNRAATESARDLAELSVKTVSINIKKGEMIVRDGEKYTQRHLTVLRALNQSTRQGSRWSSSIGASILTMLLLLGVVLFSRDSRWARRLRAREYFFLTSVFLFGMGGAKIWMLLSRAVQDTYPVVSAEFCIYAMPVSAGVMVVGLVLRAEPTVVMALLNGLLMTLMASDNKLFSVYVLVGTLTAAIAVRKITARSDVLRAGAWVGLAQAIAVISVQLFDGDLSLSGFFIYVPIAFGSGILSAALALSIMPIVEFVFRYTTELKLLELANLNHPALKELLVEAPGSYHHSIMVGALVEAAAEAIGANSLLARVMSYYHDLGKGCNAPYFIENQRDGFNPHKKLKASMSAMIIRRHVTDGLEIAKRHKLGEPILAGIAQHHGTTLIQYFYHKAVEECEEDGSVGENEYRYPGQKPQTREAALVMIGDSIEAAARTLSDPTPARLQGLVNKIINVKFTDGQLDECDLTLKDLHLMAKAFTRILTSIYHKRIEYPDMPATAQVKRREPDGDRHNEPQEPASTGDEDTEDNRPDNLRRLGL